MIDLGSFIPYLQFCKQIKANYFYLTTQNSKLYIYGYYNDLKSQCGYHDIDAIIRYCFGEFHEVTSGVVSCKEIYDLFLKGNAQDATLSFLDVQITWKAQQGQKVELKLGRHTTPEWLSKIELPPVDEKKHQYVSIYKGGKALTPIFNQEEKLENYDLKRLKNSAKSKILEAFKQGIDYAKETKFIREHINVAMLVAEKIWKVQEYKLYRINYNSMKDYLKYEIGITYTRGYQLGKAHEISVYVNNAIGKQVLVNESQCRELQKLKCHKGEELKDYVKFVQKLMSENDEITAPLIELEVKKVNGEIKEEKIEKQRKNMTYDLAHNIIEQSLSRFNNGLDEIIYQSQFKGQSRKKVVNETIAHLKNIITKLENGEALIEMVDVEAVEVDN